MTEEQQQLINNETGKLGENFCEAFDEEKRAEARDLFNKIKIEYQSPERHYHNVEHIKKLLDFLEKNRSKIQNWKAVFLAAWFHDVVYDPKANDNEEQSAIFAEEHLRQLGIFEEEISQITSLIIATKKHEPVVNNPDLEFLLDGDLAILGAEEEEYNQYSRKIRKEYEWVNDEQYRTGRTKVLKSFLERQRLYLTESVYAELEQTARRNIEREIAELS